jgi:hypothetical protein
LHSQSNKDPWSSTLLIVLLVYLFHSQTNVISIGEEVIFWLVVSQVFSNKTLTEN